LAFLIFYSIGGNSFAREGTEWITAYWYNATDSKLPRVLLIGDSIVKQYHPFVRDELAGEAYVSFYATSKGADDPSYLQELSYILDANGYSYSVIQFNNGLHALGSDRGQWEKGIRAALDLIQTKDKGAKVIWASSTPLKDPDLTEKVKELNAIAAQVMGERGIPINDLFALMDPLDRASYWVDTYHQTTEGQRQEAHQVVVAIRSILGSKPVTEAEAKLALSGAASETGPDGKITPGSSASSDHILQNPDFENDDGWLLEPLDPTKASLTFNTEEAHGGKRAATIEAHVEGVNFYQLAPAFTPGKSYAVTCWIRSEVPTQVEINLRTKNPPYLYIGDQSVDVGPEWKPYRFPLTIPSDYDSTANAFFFVFPTAGTYQVANVRVECLAE